MPEANYGELGKASSVNAFASRSLGVLGLLSFPTEKGSLSHAPVMCEGMACLFCCGVVGVSSVAWNDKGRLL